MTGQKQNRLKQGISALVLAANLNCGQEIEYHSSEQGEEPRPGASASNGRCGEYQGKYLWVGRFSGTTKRLGADCKLTLENSDIPDFYLDGAMLGNSLTFYSAPEGWRGPSLPFSYLLLKHGEFSGDDVHYTSNGSEQPEVKDRVINAFICFFARNKNLRALGYDSQIEASIESILKVEDRPFPGDIAASEDRGNSPWFTECKRENGF